MVIRTGVFAVALFSILLSISVAFGGTDAPESLLLYPLSETTQGRIEDLAQQSDVLILGEIHGTQEVPQIVAALVAALTKLNYGVLAIEAPEDEQAPLMDWAAGKTDTLPELYSTKQSDGRGNLQMLALIRLALGAPYRWKLICFDMDTKDPRWQQEWQKRDAAMATYFGDQYKQWNTQAKALAICGSLHAKIANPPAPDTLENIYWPLSPGNVNRTFWPSFAAVLQTDHPAWHVKSIEIHPHGGAYFNWGKKKWPSNVKLDDVVGAHLLKNESFDMRLDIPEVTPATFHLKQIDPADSSGEPNSAGNANSAK